MPSLHSQNVVVTTLYWAEQGWGNASSRMQRILATQSSPLVWSMVLFTSQRLFHWVMVPSKDLYTCFGIEPSDSSATVRRYPEFLFGVYSHTIGEPHGWYRLWTTKIYGYSLITCQNEDRLCMSDMWKWRDICFIQCSEYLNNLQ